MSKNNFRTLFSHRTPHSRKLQISESAFPTPIYQISKMQPLLPQGDFTANFTGLKALRPDYCVALCIVVCSMPLVVDLTYCNPRLKLEEK
ncbi:hypothetical protein TSAR_005443 [Trichomalopsis sarcophagae]|uniref:Uncharacterized protein n=1 Tax=Trichomalopsis sarcophagae TaxID=543379 RepID=A0A232F9R3_9HYME|nr:hypothetical protein TSAR_005443 [Trichomalopsis sarcophagae]